MTVRLAVAEDAPRVAEVAAVTFPLACPPGTRTEDIASFISDMLSQHHFETYIADASRSVLVDENECGYLLGYAMLIESEPGDPEIAAALTHSPTAELSKLYVLPNNHGSGVAHRLMTAALGRARELGCAGTWLGVNQQNERAQKFYRKHGFEVAGTKTFVVGAETHDDFIMQAPLQAPQSS